MMDHWLIAVLFAGIIIWIVLADARGRKKK